MNSINKCCIIDDDPIFIYGTKRLINEVEFCDEVIVYNNGEEAFSALSEMVAREQSLPEVIFLDLNMPIMNGWEFLDEFLKLPPETLQHVSMYILSSSVDPRDLEKVKEYGIINNYILKPLSTKILANIKSALRAA